MTKFLVKFLGDNCFSVSPVRDKKYRTLYHEIDGELTRRDIVVETLTGEEAEKLARAKLFDKCDQLEQSLLVELDKCCNKLSSLQNRLKILIEDTKISEDMVFYNKRINYIKRLLGDFS
jgi:hypothetical protein